MIEPISHKSPAIITLPANQNDSGAIVESPKTGKPEYTGEILLRTRPKTYRKVIELIAQGRSVLSISEECKVSRRSVDGIVKRHRQEISQKKNELVSMLTDISYLSGARVMDTVSKASCRDAIIGLGVSIEKTLLLQGQSPGVQVAIVNMPSEADREERRMLHDKLDAISAKLNEPLP